MDAEAAQPELLTDNNCELDGYWFAYNNPSTNELSTDQVYQGTYSRKFVTTGVTRDGVIQLYNAATTTGEKYRVRFRVYTSESRISYAVREGDAVGYNVDVIEYALTPNVWNRVEFEYTEVSGGSAGGLLLYDYNYDAGTYYVDDCSVKRAVDRWVDTTDDKWFPADKLSSSSSSASSSSSSGSGYSSSSSSKSSVSRMSSPAMGIPMI